MFVMYLIVLLRIKMHFEIGCTPTFGLNSHMRMTGFVIKYLLKRTSVW